MTNDLRTRVERVILSHHMELVDEFDNHWTCKCGATPILSASHLADAVIRELEPELNRHDTGCVCDDCWPDQEGD